MEFRPIFSALMRNKVGLILIASQIALTLAIVSNSLFIINERLGMMGRPSGLDEANVFSITSTAFAPGLDPRELTRADLELLRNLDGVVAASHANSLPLGGSGWGEGIAAKPVAPEDQDVIGTTMYMGDEGLRAALGVDLAEGRDFLPEEILDREPGDRDYANVVILSKTLATRLFPDGSAVGKSVYASGNGQRPLTVVGVVERLQAPWSNWTDLENSVIMPLRFNDSDRRYVIRTEPGRRDAVMAEVEKRLSEANTGRIVRGMRTFEDIRAQAYREDRAMSIILGCVVGALLLITGLGIVGLASFWVTQRYKQIGTRRALGARRGNVMRYFQIENLIITAIGLAAGAVLAIAFNLWLVENLNVPRMSWFYLPAGALGLLMLGQLAVFGPARRATRIPPAVATRSV